MKAYHQLALNQNLLEMCCHTSNRDGDIVHKWIGIGFKYVNDPSAGSPTDTLLRLLLPLNDKVYASSQHKGVSPSVDLENSPDHSIGRSDGRCVQRAGT